MRYVSGAEVLSLLSPSAAVEAVRAPLLDGFDPAADPHRVKVALSHGEMHVLPSSNGQHAGVKILGIQPPGSTEDVPLVQGAYLLMGGRSLTPHMLIDAASLTQLRTPAVAVAGVLDVLRASLDPLDVVVFGTGVQGRAHAETVEDVLGGSGGSGGSGAGALGAGSGTRAVRCTFISRREPADDFPWQWVASGSAAAAEVVSRAGLIITATSSPEPVLGADHLRDDTVVLAVGAHTVDTRELHEDVLRGAQVIVEDIDAAFREAGDVVQAVDAGAIRCEDLIPMRDAVLGGVRGGVAGGAVLDPTRRIVFKTVGMPWEDLAVAAAIAEAAETAAFR